MLTLTPDQSEFLSGIRVQLRTYRRVLGQAPTGFGKAVVGTVMAGNAVARGLTVGFICHRDFLLDQTSATFTGHGISHGFIAAGRPFNPFSQVWIGSVGTLHKRLDRVPEPQVLIVDEGHHGVARTWRTILDRWQTCKVIFLSATPWRLDGSGLDDICDVMVEGPTVAWLMEHGRLSRYKAYAPGGPDLSGVHSRAGDFVNSELAELMDRNAIIGDMVAHYRRYACDGDSKKRAIYYGVSVVHSRHIRDAFVSAGISAEHLDADNSSQERSAAACRFASGETSVLTNVDLFGEGYDLAAQAGVNVSVECVGLARPTQSLGLHLQQVGRALRPKAEPAIILDHAGNLLRHGLPDDEREWSLAARQKKKGGPSEKAACRTCPSCFAAFPIHTMICPSCGLGVVAQPREAEQVEGELQEVDVEALRRARKEEEREARTEDDLVKLGESRGYANPEGWARKKMELRDVWRSKRAPPVESLEQMRYW